MATPAVVQLNLDKIDEVLDESEVPAVPRAPKCDNACGAVGLVGKKLGIPCQEIFRRAYAEKGFTDVYSRAVFVLYVDTNRVALPPIVLAYCIKAIRAPHSASPTQTLGCIACTFQNEWKSIVTSYRWIEPSVTKHTLLGLKQKKKITAPDPNAYQNKLFEELLKSGALDEEAEWSDEML